jgi:hypothetical protein
MVALRGAGIKPASTRVIFSKIGVGSNKIDGQANNLLVFLLS